jgi:hypothetical protein
MSRPNSRLIVLVAILATLGWALWFGGIVALFLFVSVMFRESRPVAVDAAPMLFHAFERYQLLLAAFVLVCLVLWRVLAHARAIMLVFTFVALAAVAAVLSTTLVTPRMETLRRQGQSGSPEFRQLHGRSMMFYTSEAALLLLAGVALPSAVAAGTVKPPPAAATPETVPDTAAA